MKRTLLLFVLLIDQSALLPPLELGFKPIGSARHIRDEGTKTFRRTGEFDTSDVEWIGPNGREENLERLRDAYTARVASLLDDGAALARGPVGSGLHHRRDGLGVGMVENGHRLGRAGTPSAGTGSRRRGGPGVITAWGHGQISHGTATPA